jgi:hypothetical protein
MANTNTSSKCEHEVAEDLREALGRVAETSIKVVCRERSTPRKEQAKLARDLFKSLGLKGISVTTPNYSMASTVSVRLPRLKIHVSNMWPHGGLSSHHPGCQISESDRCPACVANDKMADKIEEILGRAFPNHDDRSDTQSDYFDRRWSVS